MLCGNCPQLSWPDGPPPGWQPRSMCCMEESRLKEDEERRAGRIGFADVVDTSLGPNRFQRRRAAKLARKR